MELKEQTILGRLYISNDVEEAYKFAMKYDGKFVADFELSLKGKYLVIINEK